MQRSGLSTLGGQVHVAEAWSTPLPDETAQVWFTDPPYYDAVPYADLLDFFFVWLRRALADTPFPRDSLKRKDAEIVQDETKRFEGPTKDRTFFEEKMASPSPSAGASSATMPLARRYSRTRLRRDGKRF